MASPHFKFRLERIRNLRQQAEERAREDLAHELMLRSRGEAMLRQAEGTTQAAIEASRMTASNGASGLDLIRAQAWIERSRGLEHAAALDLDRRDAEVAARRKSLLEATRERQSIDKLAERRRIEHEAGWLRREQRDLDEIALTMHRRGGAFA
ncbi:MAG: flagellar export protein FliJ [Actinomycetota bacterium]|nr:flagellar export protein FliJ [Actinomycetota bacterium]